MAHTVRNSMNVKRVTGLALTLFAQDQANRIQRRRAGFHLVRYVKTKPAPVRAAGGKPLN